MIRRLKVVLGPEAYASFRRAARASQLGKVAIPDYFAYVARVLRDHPDLLEDVVATYPEDRARRRLAVCLRENRETKHRDAPGSRAGAPAGSSASYRAEVLADGLVALRGALAAESAARGTTIGGPIGCVRVMSASATTTSNDFAPRVGSDISSSQFGRRHLETVLVRFFLKPTRTIATAPRPRRRVRSRRARRWS